MSSFPKSDIKKIWEKTKKKREKKTIRFLIAVINFKVYKKFVTIFVKWLKVMVSHHRSKLFEVIDNRWMVEYYVEWYKRIKSVQVIVTVDRLAVETWNSWKLDSKSESNITIKYSTVIANRDFYWFKGWQRLITLFN